MGISNRRALRGSSYAADVILMRFFRILRTGSSERFTTVASFPTGPHGSGPDEYRKLQTIIQSAKEEGRRAGCDARSSAGGKEAEAFNSVDVSRAGSASQHQVRSVGEVRCGRLGSIEPVKCVRSAYS